MSKKDDGRVYMMEESRTVQAPANEVDINVLVARAKAGEDLSGFVRVGQYRDMTEVPTDLREAYAIVQRAQDLFMSLDAKVRERFKNDPALMVEFLHDEKNKDEAVKLGLVEVPAKDDTLDTLKSIDQSLKASSDSKKGKPKATPDEE